MTAAPSTNLDAFMARVKARSPNESEFHQAVREVAESVMPVVDANPNYTEANVFERLTEPDRAISFRVAWQDDTGRVRVNRGYRVQFNNSIGPYKGGLRFHPSVNLSVIKFLAFEQILKNALTTLPMGGAKGGSDFDPKGKSDDEVMRFCYGFMTELSRHIGKDVDVPAGDIGVGAREIGYLFGQYKRIEGSWGGVLTGKGLPYGGSLIRPEATGYGVVYFVQEMLRTRGETCEGKTALVSGSGNVAQYAIEKLNELGAKAVTASDSGGFIQDPDGIDEVKLAWLAELKNVRRGRIREYAEAFGCAYYEGTRPWRVPADLAFPCSTENELDAQDAKALVANHVLAVGEGANMPTTAEGVEVFQRALVLYGPGKAANAGGVAVSGLEQSQNAMRLSWTRDEVDARLRAIMSDIHAKCMEYGYEVDHVDYVKGANIAGFVKVADAMVAYGVM